MDSIEDTYDVKANVMKRIDQRIQQTKEKYKGLNIPLTGQIEDPIKQSNPRDTFTCLVSSAINTMKAVGIEPKTEDEFLELIDNREDNREVRLADAMDVLRTEGCLVEFASDNPDKIIDALRDGAVAMVIRPSSRSQGHFHTQILYGLNVDDGEISFGLYDPDPSEPEMKLVPFEEYFNTLYKNEIYTIEVIRHGTVIRQ